MRRHLAWWGSTTALGFTPALVMLWLSVWLFHLFAWDGLLNLVYPGTWCLANTFANAVLLGIAGAAYVLWISAVARQAITTATGGGFVVVGAALCLRILAESLQGIVQIPLAELSPPEPYATVLPLARAFGLAAYAGGLAFVLAAVLSERRLRREAPDWAIPP